MGTIDPERERARMAAVFSTMTNEELKEAGKNPQALTEWAALALQEEMKKRGLELPSIDFSSPELASGSGDRPVVLRRYRDMPAAFVEKAALEAAGIECFLQDANVVRMDWFWSNAMGGIKLLVREKDVEEAEKFLNQASPPESPSEESGSQP